MLDLEEILTADWSIPDPDPAPEPLDPWTLLADMHISTIAAENGLARFGRYMAGEPLVRLHRAPMPGWSILCPDPRCEVWQTEFKTTAQARTAWFTHCDERRHDFTPSWPKDVPFDRPTQPICKPRLYGYSTIIELIRRRVAVDNAGRLLTYDRCQPCYDASGGMWHGHHLVVSGTTCPGQVECPKCGVRPGDQCDRSTPALSPIDFGRDGGASGHHERFTAAAEADFWLESNEDPRFPAPWRADPAPTSRKSKTPKPGMAATLQVRDNIDKNKRWGTLAIELMSAGRMKWMKHPEHAVIACRDVRAATRLGEQLTKFYGVPASAVTVQDGLTDRRHRDGLFTDLVMADARNVLASVSKDTPEAHLVWAAGVKTAALHAALDWNGISKTELTKADGDGGGGACQQFSYTKTRRGFVLSRSRRMDEPRVASWAAIAAMIRGTWLPAEVAEKTAAVLEERSFPQYTDERDRAHQWLLDVVLSAWMRVRPADLPPFDSRVQAEHVAVDNH